MTRFFGVITNICCHNIYQRKFINLNQIFIKKIRKHKFSYVIFLIKFSEKLESQNSVNKHNIFSKLLILLFLKK